MRSTLPYMKTVIVGPRPPEVESLIERRHALGQDRFDEVWKGEYHMAPAPSKAHAYVDGELAALLYPLAKQVGLFSSGPFNLGTSDDYRVPDRGLHRERTEGAWASTAAMVVEILSEGDETFDKFEFYGAHQVDEILVADPASRTIRLWQHVQTEEGAHTGTFWETGRSDLLGVSAAHLTGAVDWP